MTTPLVAEILAGGIIGYVVGKDQQVQPIYAPKLGNEAMPALPEPPEPHTHLSRTGWRCCRLHCWQRPTGAADLRPHARKCGHDSSSCASYAS